MSEGGEAKKTKAELQEETVFLRLTGSLDAHTVKINKEKRYLVALEATMKILEKDLITEVPGAFTALNDKGLPQISWPVGKEGAVAEYLAAHDFAAVDAGYTYHGAFSLGVKRVKIMSLFSLVFTSVGGPLLVLGEADPGMMQYGMAGAIIFFGASTTGLLHIITSPYVISLRRLADNSFEADTPKLTGGVYTTRFASQDVTASSTPFSTFSAKGKSFFIHKELFAGDAGVQMLSDIITPQATEEMYEQTLHKDPNDLDTWYTFARFLWKVRGDLDASEGALLKVLAADPGDDEAQDALAQVRKLRAEKPATP